MIGSPTKVMTLLSSAVLVLGLSGCETNGSTRVSSVSDKGLQGSQGQSGTDGASGANGSNSASGSSASLGSAGALAVGGLVGPGGVAGTGLLANTGDPNSRIPLISGVLVASGRALQTISGQGTILGRAVDARTPGGIPIAGRVIGVVQATGDALIRTGNGQQYLVDGLTAAPGQLVHVTVGNASVLGSPGQSPLVGASVLSPTQTTGNPLTVGVGSQGQLLTVGTTTNVRGTAQPATNGTATGVVQSVTGLLGGPGSR